MIDESHKISVGIIGCGLIGCRRAKEASKHPQTRVTIVADINPKASNQLGEKHDCEAVSDWHEVVLNPDIDMIVASTPNGLLTEIAVAGLESGKHVLMEKPMGRNLAEARKIAGVAGTAGKFLKVGFNHRYHSAVSKAHELYLQGVIGNLINIRARYGHGGRPGYEKEWRGDSELAGGGELTDQGVHIVDLIHWVAGVPVEAFSFLQTAVWPIEPLEDNGFGLFRYGNGVVASFHTSWTQWKNLFSFEIFGSKGALIIEGLGKSYGVEKLIVALRAPEGGSPVMEEYEFDEPDISWRLEWDDFVDSVMEDTPYSGTPEDGVMAMRMLDALYQSAKEGRAIRI
jgi:predicted dehydrogenase